jgi:cytochrome P450
MTDTQGKSFESLDYFTDESIIDDPVPYFEFLTSQGPVWREPYHGMVVVTGHAEAMEVYRHPELFSSCNASTGPFCGMSPVDGAEDIDGLLRDSRDGMPLNQFMAFKDPPDHDKYRLLMARLFTPKQLRDNEDFMWRLADQQLDQFVPEGRCEFIHEYSEPFTIMVVADLLGVPEDDRRRLCNALSSIPTTGAIVDEEVDPGAALSVPEEACIAYIEDRRLNPRDDVLTHLAQARFPDGSLPDVLDVAREASFLFVAGGETTTRLLGSALRFIAEDSDLQQRLRNDRALIPNFVEEMLRLEGPVKVHFRLARRRTTLGGVDIPAGATVMLAISAINRDPLHFDGPNELRADRANAQDQVSFSRGTHSCLGQSLARAESRISLERIVDRMGDIRLSEHEHGPADRRRFEYSRTFTFRGLNNLHLEFTPIL